MIANQKDAPDDRSTTEKAEDAAIAGATAAGNALVAGKRREWAQKVGADPYTSNPQLAAKLDDVAWTAYAGGFALNFAVPSIPGLGMVETADKLVYDLPPGDLQQRNDDKLKAAGVTDAARKALFVNRNFTPTLQTELADAIAALGGAAGKSLLVSLAAEAETEGDARYIRRCVQMLVAGAKDVGGWRAFTTRPADEIEAVTPDLRVVLPWAVGYMTWNAETVPEVHGPGPGGDGPRGLDIRRRHRPGEEGAAERRASRSGRTGPSARTRSDPGDLDRPDPGPGRRHAHARRGRRKLVH